MRKLAALTLSFLALLASPAMANEVIVIEDVIEVVEVPDQAGSERFVPAAPAPIPQ